MEEEIRIRVGGTNFTGMLHDRECPQTVQAVLDVLPLEARPQQWGNELYFEIPVDQSPENSRETVDIGTIAYWPRGNAFCLFYGPTPASEGEQPKAASPVNVIGEIKDAEQLQALDSPSEIQIIRELV